MFRPMASAEDKFVEFGDVEKYGTPTMDELMNLVAAEIPTDWMKFGIHLKISLDVLNGIKADPTLAGNLVLIFCEMFRMWQRNPLPGMPVTWRTILDALISPALSQFALAHSIAEKLRSKLVKGAENEDDWEQEQYDESDQSSSSSIGYYTDDDLKKLCGCGQCSLADIITRGCSRPGSMSRFPILDVHRLPKGKRQQYLYIIEKEAEEINDAFGSLCDDVCESLKVQTTVKRVINFLKSSKRFPTTETPNLELTRKLESAQDMDDVFGVLTSICSWFNHHPLGSLVKKFGSQNDMVSYERFINDNLMKYLQRSITEIPKDAFGPESIEGSGNFRLKLDHPLTHANITANKIYYLTGKVAEALSIPIDCLHLHSIKKGCLVLEYSLPIVLYEEIFSPLSYLNYLALADIVIDGPNGTAISLKSVWYGEYHNIPIEATEFPSFSDTNKDQNEVPPVKEKQLSDEKRNTIEWLQSELKEEKLLTAKLIKQDSEVKKNVRILEHQLQASVTLYTETQQVKVTLEEQNIQLLLELEEYKQKMMEMNKTAFDNEKGEIVPSLKDNLDEKREDLLYTGMMYHEQKGTRYWKTTYTVTRDLKVLKEYLRRECPHVERDQINMFKFSKPDGILNLSFKESQPQPGWTITPHSEPMEIYQSAVDKDPMCSSCSYSIYALINEAGAAKEPFHCPIQLTGIEPSCTIYVYRPLPVEEWHQPSAHHSEEVTLIIRNIEDELSGRKLKSEFMKFGNVTSFKIMYDEYDGFGVVSFSSREEAFKAVIEMNGRIIISKPLYVSIALPKEQKNTHLPVQHKERVIRNTSQGHQMYPVQAVPSHWPSSSSSLQQKRTANPHHQRIPSQQHFSQGRDNVRGRLSTQRPTMSLRSCNQPPPFDCSTLAQMEPFERRQAIGNYLYQAIAVTHPDKAGKITGMLLEMDTSESRSELLHLLESPVSLKSKVEEAVEILRQHLLRQQQGTGIAHKED